MACSDLSYSADWVPHRQGEHALLFKKFYIHFCAHLVAGTKVPALVLASGQIFFFNPYLIFLLLRVSAPPKKRETCRIEIRKVVGFCPTKKWDFFRTSQLLCCL